MTSVYWTYPFKGSIFKYSHIRRSWGLGPQPVNLGYTQCRPEQMSKRDPGEGLG